MELIFSELDKKDNNSKKVDFESISNLKTDLLAVKALFTDDIEPFDELNKDLDTIKNDIYTMRSGATPQHEADTLYNSINEKHADLVIKIDKLLILATQKLKDQPKQDNLEVQIPDSLNHFHKNYIRKAIEIDIPEHIRHLKIEIEKGFSQKDKYSKPRPRPE